MQSRTEIANLKLTIEKMEREIQTLRSELKGFRARNWEVWGEMGDISDICRPREWTLELAELAVRVYSDYCWKNVLSESQRNKLHQVGLHDYTVLDHNAHTARIIVEAFSKHAFYRPVPYSDMEYDSDPALRIWQKEGPRVRGIINLILLKERLIESPRPYYACRRDWAKRYANCEPPHLPNKGPPTKAAFARLIRSETSDVLAADVTPSAEGLWSAEAEPETTPTDRACTS